MGLGIGGSGFSRHGDRATGGDGEESLHESAGDGGLLRSGHSLLRRQLHHGSFGSGREVSAEHFVRGLRIRAHGVFADRKSQEDEKRSGELHGQGYGTLSILG